MAKRRVATTMGSCREVVELLQPADDCGSDLCPASQLHQLVSSRRGRNSGCHKALRPLQRAGQAGDGEGRGVEPMTQSALTCFSRSASSFRFSPVLRRRPSTTNCASASRASSVEAVEAGQGGVQLLRGDHLPLHRLGQALCGCRPRPDPRSWRRSINRHREALHHEVLGESPPHRPLRPPPRRR